MPGTESQSAERRNVGGSGAESVIRKFLKLIATAQVFPDATDHFPYPLDRSELAGRGGKRLMFLCCPAQQRTAVEIRIPLTVILLGGIT